MPLFMALGYANEDASQRIELEQARSPKGVLMAFTCRQCGYTQLFATLPADIPIGEAFRTKLVRGPEPIGPYR